MHKLHVKLVDHNDVLSLDLDDVSVITSEWTATEEVGGSNDCRCVVGPTPHQKLIEAIESALLQQDAGCEYGPRLFEITITPREEYYEFQRVDEDPRVIREFFNPLEIEDGEDRFSEEFVREWEKYIFPSVAATQDPSALIPSENDGSTYQHSPEEQETVSDYLLILERIKKHNKDREDFVAYNESCSDPEFRVTWETWVRIGGLN